MLPFSSTPQPVPPSLLFISLRPLPPSSLPSSSYTLHFILLFFLLFSSRPLYFASLLSSLSLFSHFLSFLCNPIFRESLQSLLATQIVDEECGTSRYLVNLQSPFLTCARDLLLVSDYGVLSLGGGRDKAGAGVVQGRV